MLGLEQVNQNQLLWRLRAARERDPRVAVRAVLLIILELAYNRVGEVLLDY